MAVEKYIIGTNPVPAWCKDRLSLYRKRDGTTGIEFFGHKSTINLNIGDVLIKYDKYIGVERVKAK